MHDKPQIPCCRTVSHSDRVCRANNCPVTPSISTRRTATRKSSVFRHAKNLLAGNIAEIPTEPLFLPGLNDRLWSSRGGRRAGTGQLHRDQRGPRPQRCVRADQLAHHAQEGRWPRDGLGRCAFFRGGCRRRIAPEAHNFVRWFLKNAAMQHTYRLSELHSSSQQLRATTGNPPPPSCQSESKPGASPPAPGFIISGRSNVGARRAGVADDIY